MNMGPKRKWFKCLKCHQKFDRLGRLRNHEKRVKCDHCLETFCSYQQLEKHKRSIITPVIEIPNLNQKIQGQTGYNSDLGIQAVFLGK